MVGYSLVKNIYQNVFKMHLFHTKYTVYYKSINIFTDILL